MYERKTDMDIRCPLEYGMRVFGGKWKTRVICVLSQCDNMRYSELRRQMTNVTDAVLASTLKELMADGLVSRRRYDEIPPRVEYSLTEKGNTVVPLLQSICVWAGMYFNEEDGENTFTFCQKCNYRNG